MMVKVPWRGVPKAEVKEEAPEPPIRKGEVRVDAPPPPIRRARSGPEEGKIEGESNG
jgi:hypothetical protein